MQCMYTCTVYFTVYWNNLNQPATRLFFYYNFFLFVTLMIIKLKLEFKKKQTLSAASLVVFFYTISREARTQHKDKYQNS